MDLAEKDCVRCRGGTPPLKGNDLERLHEQLAEGWRVVNEHHLEKQFNFGSYRDGIDFTNAVAEIAEEQQHHPDLLLTYPGVQITIWTHAIDGLTESDFIFAAKAEEAAQTLAAS